MKDHKNKKSETTAIKDMRDFQKAKGIMESIAEAGSKEYLQESADYNESSISKDGKADWVSLTKIDCPSLNESFEPRFADTTEKLNGDDKVLITRSMKKYLAESSEEYIPLNRIPGMSVVIANDTGLSPIAVEDYIDTLINEAPNKRDSQQKAHDLTGRVDGAAETTKDTVPDASMFPGDANETAAEEGAEIMPSDVIPGLEPEAPEVVNTEPEFVAPEEPMEEPVAVAPEAPIPGEDEPIAPEGDIDADLAELDAELSKEIEGAEMPEINDADDIVVPEEGGDVEENGDDGINEEIEKALEEDEDEEEEESFMESLSSKKKELSAIRAKFESIAAKYKNAPAVLESGDSDSVKAERKLSAKLESIANKINSMSEKTGTPVSEKPSVSAQLESIRQGLAESKQQVAKLESIRESIFESAENTVSKKPTPVVNDEADTSSVWTKLESIRDGIEKEAKIQGILESIMENDADGSSEDDRKAEIAKGLETLTESINNGALLESSDAPALTKEEKIQKLRARFESKINSEFESIK